MISLFSETSMLSTRLTRLLQIRHPVVQSGMRWLARAELVAAVSNAGGLGLLSAHTQEGGSALRAEIERTRALTKAPFGVNITLLPGAPFDYDGYVQAVIDLRVPVVETSGSNPVAVITRLKQAGVTVIHKCTAVKHAAKAVSAGADAIAVDGFECAGHTGMDEISSLLLLRAAAGRLNVPLLACGGFGDGPGLAAALAAGAEGIAMGTRFMLTRESPLHDAIKQRMLQASERDTVQVGRSTGDPVRVLRNAGAQALVAGEKSGTLSSDTVHEQMDARLWMAAFEQGDTDSVGLPVGMVVGTIDDLPTCEELIDRLVADATKVITQRLAAFVDGPAR
jgi:NADH:quinone reductase (non-electrogenic)